MARIIKTAKKKEKVFNTGDKICWTTCLHDGRSYDTFSHTGVIVKVCRVNLHVEDESGNIWEVSKSEAK